MKIKNMVLVIMACFLIFISMSCICACDDADMTNTRDVNDIIVDDAIDDSMDVIDDGASSADIDNSGSSADMDNSDSSADDSMDVIDDGASSDSNSDSNSDSIGIVDGDSIIENMTNDVPKYNDKPISNVKDEGNSFVYVQYLINDIPKGSVLYLYKDYTMQKDESSIIILNDITIDGNNHKLDADKNGIIFSIHGGNVVLSNLELTNGKVLSSGGAIDVKSAKSLRCSNVYFLNNYAHCDGGAVHIFLTPSTFTNCTFKDNSIKSFDGGAIYSNEVVTCIHSLFESNDARFNKGTKIRGAAIYASALVNCTDCEFIKNDASYGIIYGEKVIVANSIFKDNRVRLLGAIFSKMDSTVKNCEFISNYGDVNMLSPEERSYGAAIYSCASLTVDSCKFSYNTADDCGGAIYAENGLKLVGDNEFIANEAHDFGGAIYSKEDVYINWNDNGKTTFRSNRANSDSGGAIYSEKTVYVGNVVFDSNFAEDDGGAIFSKGDVYVNWNGDGETIFKSNRANTDDGGAIYSKGNVYVKNSDFSDCYAHDGGAIFAEGNTIIDSSSFSDNYATHQGGAIYEKKGIALRGYTYFTGNGAKDSGGAIYTAKFDEDVWHASFKNNKAGDDGGAIYIDHENHETFTECDFEGNQAGDEGGAIYLDDGDSHLSLIRNNLVDNKAKSGYTVYNHGNYDDIKDNWHGSTSPNFDNQFKKYRLILKDKVITPSSYAKSRISW